MVPHVSTPAQPAYFSTLRDFPQLHEPRVPSEERPRLPTLYPASPYRNQCSPVPSPSFHHQQASLSLTCPDPAFLYLPALYHQDSGTSNQCLLRSFVQLIHLIGG